MAENDLGEKFEELVKENPLTISGAFIGGIAGSFAGAIVGAVIGIILDGTLKS